MCDVSIVIVNYNVAALLAQTLRSVARAAAGLAVETYVVDNASSDGSIGLVRAQFPGVQVIANPANLGFARANNQALARVRGRFVLLLNPDTVLQPDTLRSMLQFFEARPAVGLAGCRVLNPDGSLEPACRRSMPTPGGALAKLLGLSRLFPRSRTFGQYNMTYLSPDVACPVDAVSGAFMMVRRSVFEQVGGLDERFFLYGEDLDWCRRIREAGWEVWYTPVTSIIHYKGSSARQRASEARREFYRSMHTFVTKYGQAGAYRIPLWVLRAGIWVQTALAAAGRLGGRLTAAAARTHHD